MRTIEEKWNELTQHPSVTPAIILNQMLSETRRMVNSTKGCIGILEMLPSEEGSHVYATKKYLNQNVERMAMVIQKVTDYLERLEKHDEIDSDNKE